jgi:hypothetical protein
MARASFTDRRRKFPVNREKFPAQSSREFGPQGTENAGKIQSENRPEGAFLREFPAKFPASREFSTSRRSEAQPR